MTGCISISAFAFLLGIPIGITRSTVESKICVVTAGVKKYKSIIKKKMFLAKAKLNIRDVLISKDLIN